uniref:Protein translocase subunit SecA n=1 Tax=Neogoniolithon spectabile TaxID=231755 RepID=A0A3G3MH14_9FLOR|nr:preprotein translocase subunit SecA [Neogoniolithon spectabile]AYR06124.1 preprotein translocase subunit SecA [Neogoniolithon spectabile]
MLKFLINKEYGAKHNLKKLVYKINYIQQNDIRHLSNQQIKHKTNQLKKQLHNGYTLDQILPEAFAVAKEAIKRVLKLEMFEVQVMGGIVLHQGKIAEMKTGEGKTIVSILPAYLNCLNNYSVQIITVNDYLARRDYQWVKPVYEFLDLSVGLIQQDMPKEIRKYNYFCNITYVTNSELGFDYLKDNMALNKSEVIQPNFYYAIIDEVDSILIDEARTPLIISGPAEIQTDKYFKSRQISEKLKLELHYEVDEKNKNITLTEKGIIFCETSLDLKNLYDVQDPWIHYIINALKAKELFLKDQHYIITKSQIIIVDEFTGRLMEGRRWSDGLHQAIESKENVPIQKENKTLASITYQNLFLLYDKLSGMTGTAKTEEIELDKIYNLSVISIPTHKPCIRQDFFDLIYKSEYLKWQAIAQECYLINRTGQPILVGTTNIEKSEMLAKMLDIYTIKYSILNAKPENVSREAQIIAQAGQKYSVTISTNMAGRGTDIILGGNAKSITEITLSKYIKDIVLNSLKYSKKQLDIDTKVIHILDKSLKSLKQCTFIQNMPYNQVDSYIAQIPNLQNNNIHSQSLRDVYNEVLLFYKNKFSEDKKEIIKLGGLYVIGTERHESRRKDNQLRGRAGRQGDPGSSRFFLSLDDNLLRIFGGETIKQLVKNLKIDDDIPIESNILSKSLNAAQKKVESHFYDIRKQLFEYDAVINKQRQAIYSERKKILESDFLRDYVLGYAESTTKELLTSSETKRIDDSEILNNIYYIFSIPINWSTKYFMPNYSQSNIVNLYKQIYISYDLKEAYLENLKSGLIRQLEKYYLLEQIDLAWQNHLERMQLLKESISWRSYGQQDPLIEYKNEAFKLFIKMTISIRQNVTYLLLRSRLILNSRK